MLVLVGYDGRTTGGKFGSRGRGIIAVGSGAEDGEPSPPQTEPVTNNIITLNTS